MGNPVVHFEITAKDPEKASAFYGELFGWKLNPIPGMGYTLVDTDAAGSGIAGGIGAGDESLVTFYVEVPDVQAALDRAVALGSKVVRPVVGMEGGVTTAVFSDPQGNVIGLVEAGAPRS
jgi:uncharacterized protein